MTDFDPVSAALGGALIGLATTLLMLLNGRVAGISGIVGDALTAATGAGWRIAFIVGLIAAPLALVAAGHLVQEPGMPASWAVIAIGGLLVGIGTRLGGGCTSGHGVCGTARLAPRSLVATMIFMVTAMLVVFLVRHGPGA